MAISAENLRFILGLKLKNLRTQKKLSLKDLAGQAGLSISYLSEIEKGKKYPKPDKLLGLSRVLGVPFDELVSVSVDETLNPLTETLRSAFFTEFPFALFGLETEDLFHLFASDPTRAGALVRTFLEIGQMYDVRVEHFLFAALRSYQLMHDNYFEEIEDQADAFRRKAGPQSISDHPEHALQSVLETQFGYRIDDASLQTDPDLRGFRSVFADGDPPVLHVNPDLMPIQKAFVFGREIGYRVMNLKQRALTSSWVRAESFEQVLNNFRASYFSGAVLIDRRDLMSEMRSLFARPAWDPRAFLDILNRFGATPELFMYRVGQLLPSLLEFREFFFLRLHTDVQTGQTALTKVFNRSEIALPQGFWLDEHYCRRWSGMNLLANPVLDGEEIGVHAQRSRFLDGDEFFVFSLGRPLALSSSTVSVVSLGFRISPAFRKHVKFWNDPAVPQAVVNITCERCPLDAASCRDRIAEPILYRQEDALNRKNAALEALFSRSSEPVA